MQAGWKCFVTFLDSSTPWQLCWVSLTFYLHVFANEFEAK